MESFCSNSENDVDAGISTMISVFDDLGPFVFRQNTEKTRPLRDQMDGCLFPARFRISTLNVVHCDITFHFLYLDLACKHFCFPPRKKNKQVKWKYQIHNCCC